jgi:hypothetical protein
MEFETVLKVMAIIAAGVGIPVAAYGAIVAIQAIWVHPHRKRQDMPGVAEELEALRARITDLEAQQQRVAELEERVDFAERLLTQRREAERLPQE